MSAILFRAELSVFKTAVVACPYMPFNICQSTVFREEVAVFIFVVLYSQNPFLYSIRIHYKLYQLLPYFSFRSLYSHPYIASANAPVRLHRRCLSTSGHRAALCIADVKSQAFSKQYQALIRYVNNPSVSFESFHCHLD